MGRPPDFSGGHPKDYRGIGMDVREAVKDKANYADIVRYFKGLGTLDVNQMLLLTDVIEEMSEQIFEHYRALQLMLRKAIADVIDKRRQSGDFSFLSESDKGTLKEIIIRGSENGALNPEHFEDYLIELQ